MIFFFLNNIYSYILFFENSEMDCVVINGYFPSLTIKSVLNTITEEILGTEDTFSSNTEHVAHILRYVEPEPQAFILAETRTEMPSGFGTGFGSGSNIKGIKKSKNQK
jgi:hypothetical protein